MSAVTAAPRAKLVLDASVGTIGTGSTAVAFRPSSDVTEVLRRYLYVVWVARGVDAGTRVPLRSDDVKVLSEFLGISVPAVTLALHELLIDREWLEARAEPLVLWHEGAVVAMDGDRRLIAVVEEPAASPPRPLPPPSSAPVVAGGPELPRPSPAIMPAATPSESLPAESTVPESTPTAGIDDAVARAHLAVQRILAERGVVAGVTPVPGATSDDDEDLDIFDIETEIGPSDEAPGPVTDDPVERGSFDEDGRWNHAIEPTSEDAWKDFFVNHDGEQRAAELGGVFARRRFFHR
jgi:hypothetical protein